MTKQDADNRSNQLNPNNDTFWQARGFDEKPNDWEQRTSEDKAEAHKENRSGKSSRR